VEKSQSDSVVAAAKKFCL